MEKSLAVFEGVCMRVTVFVCLCLDGCTCAKKKKSDTPGAECAALIIIDWLV